MAERDLKTERDLKNSNLNGAPSSPLSRARFSPAAFAIEGFTIIDDRDQHALAGTRSSFDLPKFAVLGHNNLYLASMGDSFVFSLSTHENIRSGHIALNSIQRRCAKVSAVESVAVSRFVSPENFNLALLTLELDFIKRVGNRSEQIDAVVLAKQLWKRFLNQVMTAGQKVLFEYQGNNYSFTVSQAAVEGQDKSNSLEQGMISDDTYMIPIYDHLEDADTEDASHN